MNLMDPKELAAIGHAVKRLSGILSDKILTTVGMVMCAVLFGWTLYDPDWIRVAACCAFAILVYLPIVKQERNKGETREHD